MMEFLEIVWSRFKALRWWQQALLFLPAVVLLVIGIILFFFRGDSDSGKLLKDALKKNKAAVDNHVKEKLDKVDQLGKEEKRLEKEREAIQEEIKANEKAAAKVSSDIDRAVDDNDIAELNRIRRRLNKQAETRRFRTSRPPKP